MNRSTPGESAEFQWAGANNPLWYIPGGAGQTAKLQEIKADKQPIGYSEEPKPFTTHTFQLSRGNGENGLFYLFTDGYPDQFGGPKGKKFKYKQVEELLVSIRDKTMPEQKEILHKTFNDWKGELEQVDDICIIGIKI
jgi:serine phosphatase RsbU (regulator of sigma subunit)